MADTMIVEGDDTVKETGTEMRRQEDKVRSTPSCIQLLFLPQYSPVRRQGSLGTSTRKAHKVLPAAEVSSFIRNRPSDLEGTKQLLFHLSFALAAAWCVKHAREEGSMAALIASELALGLVSSFYFTGFHEMCDTLLVWCGLGYYQVEEPLSAWVCAGSTTQLSAPAGSTKPWRTWSASSSFAARTGTGTSTGTTTE